MAFVQIPLRLSRIVALAAVCGAALCATQANANTISYSTGQAYGDGSTLGSEKMKFGTKAAGSVGAGALWATETPGSSSFWVYCLDPLVGAKQSTQETPKGLTAFLGSSSYFGAAAYGNVGSVYVKQANTTIVQNNLVELYSHAYSDSLTNSTKSAAFQYAIWEILGETEANYGTKVGGLLANTTVGNNDGAFQTQADAYLAALTNTSVTESAAWSSVNGANLSTAKNFTYTVYTPNTTGSSQAFLGVVASSTTNTSGVPEPGTGVLAAMGALAWFGVRQRKNKAA